MLKIILPIFIVTTVLSGCKSMNEVVLYAEPAAMYVDPPMGDMPLNAIEGGIEELQTEHMLIWIGSMTIEVSSISNAATQVSAKTLEAGGYIESSSQNNYNERPTSSLTLRVPSGKLDELLGSLDGVGEITSKRLFSEDVTERYVDMQARLGTKKKLRDRLQKLLDRADEVKDVLAIEKELTRLQADIDSMTARLKTMKGKVDLSSLTITLEAKKNEKVLGPLVMFGRAPAGASPSYSFGRTKPTSSTNPSWP